MTADFVTDSFFSNLKATQKGLLLVLVPLSFELLFVVAFLILLVNAQQDFKRIEQAKQVVVEMHKLLDLSLRTSFLVFDPRVTDRAIKIKEMKSLAAKLSHPGSMGEISISKNPELRRLCNQADSAQREVFGLLLQCVRELENAPPDVDTNGVTRRYEQILQLSGKYDMLCQKVVDIEIGLFEEHPREVKHFQLCAILLLLSMLIIGCVSSLILVGYFSRHISRRLIEIGGKAQQLTFGGIPMPDGGTDEIAQLDRVICDAGQTLNEIRLRESAVLHNSADVLLSLDAKLKVVDVGESSNVLWHRSPEELRGLSLLQLIEVANTDMVTSAFSRIAEGSGTGQVEGVVRTKDKTPMDTMISVRWSPARSMYYCAAHDITALRSVEALRRRFLATASHDLRTPMSSITLILSLLASQKRELLAPGVLTEIEKSLESAKQLTALVNEFLELEKLEAGRGSLELAPISVLDLCVLASETLSVTIETAGVEFEFPKKDCIIFADENRILKVMEILLANSIRRTESGASINVSLNRAQGFATIGITDYGPVVTDEEAEVMFDKFSLSKDSAVRRSGLGLAIAKAIIAAHDGKIGVINRVSGGTTFYFMLPEKAAQQGDEEL